MDIVSLNIKSAKLLERIKRIVEIDNNLRDWGDNIEPESMPIDILHCRSVTAGAFHYWDYFFSNLDGKLLSITVDVENFEATREQLIVKHGQCINNDYCVNNGNILLLVKDKDNDKFFIVIFFESNIKDHYEIIEEKQQKKRNLQKESIKEAF